MNIHDIESLTMEQAKAISLEAVPVKDSFLLYLADLGGAFGPSLVGTVTQQAGDNLQAGMLAGSIFPLVLVVALILFIRQAAKKD